MTSPEEVSGEADPAPVALSPSSARRRGPGPVLMVTMGVLVLLAGLFAYVGSHHHGQQSQLIRVSGIPSGISTSQAHLMALAPVPAKPAPAFTRTDHTGKPLALSSFRGRTVVLEFMDSHCVDICPIVSQEFIDAYHDLGPVASSKVVFVAVNVNSYHVGVTDVAAFSREHQLTSIPSWHFFTGAVRDLEGVWNAYGIDVQNPGPSADVVHSSFVFFIGPDGRERYLANPTDEHTSNGTAYLPPGQITSWAQGIAVVARSL